MDAEKLMQKLKDRGEIIRSDDGFFVYCPDKPGGYMTPHVLRVIADGLDKMNAPWQKMVDEYFNSEK